MVEGIVNAYHCDNLIWAMQSKAVTKQVNAEASIPIKYNETMKLKIDNCQQNSYCQDAIVIKHQFLIGLTHM